MAMTNKMLHNIYCGQELDKLAEGSERTFEIIRQVTDQYGEGRGTPSAQAIARHIISFTRARNAGRYGGQITAGDAAFIGAFMETIRPDRMLEIGVCSGQSSAYILTAAKQAKLLPGEGTFLHSIDLVSEFGPDKLPVGQVVPLGYEQLMPWWDLQTGRTSKALLDEGDDVRLSLTNAERPLVFIDAAHSHPWPLIDTLILDTVLPEGNWLLLQDVRLTERWLITSVERGVACPALERGAEYVAQHWPGRKIWGVDMCFNMAAVRTGLSAEERRRLVADCLQYPPEVRTKDFAELEPFIQSLAE